MSLKLYRYKTNGEGIFQAGKRLLPSSLVEEGLEAKKWLKKPKLPKGRYVFYMTEKGKDLYEKTLLLSHKKYLKDIRREEISRSQLKNIIYEDEYQVVERID